MPLIRVRPPACDQPLSLLFTLFTIFLALPSETRNSSHFVLYRKNYCPPPFFKNHSAGFLFTSRVISQYCLIRAIPPHTNFATPMVTKLAVVRLYLRIQFAFRQEVLFIHFLSSFIYSYGTTFRRSKHVNSEKKVSFTLVSLAPPTPVPLYS